jgi:hypothetical protein
MRLLILSLLLLGLLAAPAAADSLVYTKDGNVWAARPDGSGQVQITKDGSPQNGYETPSQADDGTILAVRGSRFAKFDRTGRATGTFGSVLTDKPAAIGALGPWDAKISPDGQKVAYWLGILGGWYDYSTGTYYSDPESAVVYQSAVDGRQLGETLFYEEPSWTADSQHLLLFDSLNGGVPQVVVGTVGASHNDLQGWFHDRDTFTEPEGWHPIGAGELTRGGNRLALLRAPTNSGNGGAARGSGNRIVVYDVSGFGVAPRPLPCGFSDGNGGELGPPSWSPDGHAVAWAEADGVWVGTIGDPASCDGWSVKLAVPGGREPDWGPGDPGAGAAAGAPAPQGGANAGTAPQRVRLRARALVRRAALLRRGLPVRVSCASACGVAAKLTLRRRPVARGRTHRASAGQARVAVRVTGGGRRAVKRLRRATLRLSVTVRPAGAAAQTITRAVRVRR